MPSKRISKEDDYDLFYIDVNSEVYKKFDNINKRNKALEEKYLADKENYKKKVLKLFVISIKHQI